MKHAPHFKNDELIQHVILNKNSAQNLKPKILYAGDMKPSENWYAEPHDHDFCEIIFVRSGSGTVQLENKVLNFKQGDIIIYNQHVKHNEASSNITCYFFAINKFKLENLPENCLLKDEISPIINTGENFDIFNFYFSQLVLEAKNKLYYYDDIQIISFVLF